MQQNQNTQPPSPLGNSNWFGEVIGGLYRAVCLTVEVFVHRTFGYRYVGAGLAGVVILLAFSTLFPNDDPLPLLCFTGAYLILWIMATASLLIRRWRSRDRQHSHYTGRPWLWQWLLPSWKEDNFKHLEAIAIGLLGTAIHPWTHPLGDYLVMAASMVLARNYCLAVRQRDQAIAMNDMVIEQQMVVDRFRDLQQR
jgi:hypothetical protein